MIRQFGQYILIPRLNSSPISPPVAHTISSLPHRRKLRYQDKTQQRLIAIIEPKDPDLVSCPNVRRERESIVGLAGQASGDLSLNFWCEGLLILDICLLVTWL